MAQIRIKKRAASGSDGAPSSLASSELAFNESDLKLYYGFGDNGSAVASSVITVGGSGAFCDLTTNQTLAGNKTFSNNVTVTGDLTVNGTTTSVATTNTTIKDNLLELNSGVSSNANDAGILIERGSTGDNAYIGWDESADEWVLGTTTATSSATGDISLTIGTLVANVRGNVTGNTSGTAGGISGTPNITVGEVIASSLDISGNVDIDGTLETDGLSIEGTTVTSTATELNLLDGITAGTLSAGKAIITDSNKDITGGRNITITGELDAATLDISGNVDVDGTLETDALSINGTTVTSTATELNILDGVTASASDINLIDGITNGTVSASKAIITDANKDITGLRNVTITGELDAASLDISGNVDVDGTLEADAITVNNTPLASSATTDTTDASNIGSGTLNVARIADGSLGEAKLDISNSPTDGHALKFSSTNGLTWEDAGTSTNATNATKIQVSDNESTNENNLIAFVGGAVTTNGKQDLEMDGDFHYNPGTGLLTVGQIDGGTF